MIDMSNADAQTSQELPRLARDTTVERPWPVSVLSGKFHDAVERWPGAWVTGQITQINSRRAGSVYLTLRDDFEDVAMEVNGFGQFAAAASAFVQGDRVTIHGRPNVWMKRTSLSFRGDAIVRVGAGGSLKAQIDQLRRTLKGEGLFDADRKVPLPEFPRCIGLICAPQARAEGDVITNVRLRWPVVDFKVVHVHVQGEQCPADVIDAIRKLDADPDVDVIIVARGGGAFEDLIGFSDEGVVRAAADCVTPLVTAVGHEDDWTLIDLAADLRASTPTDAAKKVVPDVREQLQLVASARQQMRLRIEGRIAGEIRLIEGYANRPSLRQPLTMLEPHQRFLDDARQRMDIGLRRMADYETMTVEKLRASLTALSPQSTLDRGYAVVQTADGHVLADASAVRPGDELTLTLRRGRITATADAVGDATAEA
ncbi:exodeoxyribonuclease VII large subunit [Bifidobacterium avesanii]|nr:exodeoxyribonuclease VII large subunit [Bifidobacterium avesanii]